VLMIERRELFEIKQCKDDNISFAGVCNNV
jgi:hypothetical protein